MITREFKNEIRLIQCLNTQLIFLTECLKIIYVILNSDDIDPIQYCQLESYYGKMESNDLSGIIKAYQVLNNVYDSLLKGIRFFLQESHFAWSVDEIEENTKNKEKNELKKLKFYPAIQSAYEILLRNSKETPQENIIQWNTNEQIEIKTKNEIKKIIKSTPVACTPQLLFKCIKYIKLCDLDIAEKKVTLFRQK